MMLPYFVEEDKQCHTMCFLDLEGVDMGKIIRIMRVKSEDIDLEQPEFFSAFSFTHLLLLMVHSAVHYGFGILAAVYV